MKNNYQNIILFAFTFIHSASLFSQTVNLGQVAVKEDTQVSFLADFTNTSTADFLNDGELYLFRNIRNDGLFSFSSGSNGSVYFNGDITQSILGEMSIELYNVEFNNISLQPAFSLFNDLEIYGTAEFANGIIDNSLTGSGRVIFYPGGSSSGMNDDSFVNGVVEKRGNEAFTFPIGKQNYYRNARIASSLEVVANISSEYKLENSDLLYPHSNLGSTEIYIIDDTEYWTVEGELENAGLLLTLSWDTNTTPQEITNEISQDNIHIVRWDSENSQWLDEGGIVNFAENTVTTPVEVSGSGVFTLARVKEYNTTPEIVVYNAVSPDGNGENDYFIIENIELYPKNKVQIFNRWGVKVFETDNYGADGNVFNGLSDGRATINSEGKLQTGTYFYVIEYEYTGDTDPRTIKKAGYLYLNND